MKRLLGGFALSLVLCTTVVAIAAIEAHAQCVDCIARQCEYDVPVHTICDQLGTDGCIASGSCPQGPLGCIRGKLSTRVVRVAILHLNDKVPVNPKGTSLLLSHLGPAN